MPITRLLMAAVLASAMFGQSNVGEISGQVSDSTGAAIPGCVVTVTHMQTGLKRTIETAEGGVLVFAGLPEGKYKVAAEKQGFRTGTELTQCLRIRSARFWRTGAEIRPHPP